MVVVIGCITLYEDNIMHWLVFDDMLELQPTILLRNPAFMHLQHSKLLYK